jgi:hypothetical protein
MVQVSNAVTLNLHTITCLATLQTLSPYQTVIAQKKMFEINEFSYLTSPVMLKPF